MKNQQQQQLDDFVCWFKHWSAHASILIVFNGKGKEFN